MSTSGCIVYRQLHIGGMEPQVRPLQQKPYEVVGEAESKISNFNLLWAVTVTDRPDFDRALREMVSEKGGDDIIEVRWWRERQHWVLGSINILRIKGKVIRYIEE